MAGMALSALSTKVESVSEYGSAYVFGSIIAIATESARITHSVATVGSPATYQPATPAAAIASRHRSTRLVPPTPRLNASTRISAQPASCTAPITTLQLPPSARWEATTITDRVVKIAQVPRWGRVDRASVSLT